MALRGVAIRGAGLWHCMDFLMKIGIGLGLGANFDEIGLVKTPSILFI